MSQLLQLFQEHYLRYLVLPNWQLHCRAKLARSAVPASPSGWYIEQTRDADRVPQRRRDHPAQSVCDAVNCNVRQTWGDSDLWQASGY